MNLPASSTGRVRSFDPERAGLAQALRDLATYYKTHPSARIPERVDLTYYTPYGTDKENFAEVDRIAAAIGVEAHWRSGYYVARLDFGGSVAYEAVAVPATALAMYPAVPGRKDAA